MNRSATLSTASAAREAALGAAQVLGFSLVIALGAKIAIPLPFTPVPVTLQTLAVLAAPALLGTRRGTLAVALYLAEGLMGLPVFATPVAGPAALLMPTSGYLLGFLGGAAVTGLMLDRFGRRSLSAFAAVSAGHAVILAMGVFGLSFWMPLPVALAQGVLPFLLGEVLKSGALSTAIAARRR